MATSPRRVLIADDIRGVRESVRIALADAGHHAVAVESGSAALERLSREAFDVLVTDIWMPDTDGLELLRQVRSERPGLRVFAMTGGGPRMTIETATSLAEVWGAEQVFVKPFDEDRLVRAIEAG